MVLSRFCPLGDSNDHRDVVTGALQPPLEEISPALHTFNIQCPYHDTGEFIYQVLFFFSKSRPIQCAITR